jgi:acetoin utilization deacetylase AcuC-like enzyme
MRPAPLFPRGQALAASLHRAVSTAASASPSTRASPPRPLSVFFADWARVDLPDGHRFPMDKYARTREALRRDAALVNKITLLESPKVDVESELLLTHCPQYVQRVLTLTLREDEVRKIGFPMAQQNVERSLASTGGTVACMREVMSGARASAQIAGGTHHAYRDRGEGFCVFNDVAVAINVARREFADALRDRKILVIDLDVHQGNGTAKIFEGDAQVVTFSMHGEKNYPIKTREKSTHDVELPDDCEDEEYLSLLEQWLPKLFDDYDPAIVFFQAGIDALKEDSFGRLAMSREGLLRRNNAVYSMCIAREVPLVITMGGGYSKPIEPSLDAHVDVFRSAALRFTAPQFF